MEKQYEGNRRTKFIKLLSLYLFFIPLDLFPVVPGVSVSKLLIGIPLIGAVLEIKKSRYLNGYSLWALLYPLIVYVSLYFTEDFEASVSVLITISTNCLVVVLFSMRDYSAREIEYLYKSYALSGWLLIILSIIYADFTAVYGRFTIVVGNKIVDPNYLCGYFIFPMCFYLDQFYTKRRKLSLVCAFAMLVVPLFTGSRGGLVALIGAMVLYLGIRASKKNSTRSGRKIMGAVIAFAVTVLIVREFLPPAVLERLGLDAILQDGGSNRILQWSALMKKFNQSSVFRQAIGHGAATVQNYSWRDKVAHNVWIEALIEYGVTGAVALFAMYFAFFKYAFKLQGKLLFVVFVGYLWLTLTLSLYSYKPIWNSLLLISMGMKTRHYSIREKSDTMEPI